MENEGRKIMHHPGFRASVTCVRVPVYRSHSVAVSAEFEKPVTAAAALLGGVSPNVVVVTVRSGFAGRGTITMLGAVLSIGYANAAGSSVSVVVLVALRRSAASNGFAVSMSGAARRSWSPTAAAIAT